MPCAKRLNNGGWCVLPDMHDGPCVGVALTRPHTPATEKFGPKDATRRRA